MTDIVLASVAVIAVVIAIRSAYGLGHAAGMVEVKFPLHDALTPYGLYLSHANETIRPMSQEEKKEIGLTCPAHLETEIQALCQKLNNEGLDIYFAKLGAETYSEPVKNGS